MDSQKGKDVPLEDVAQTENQNQESSETWSMDRWRDQKHSDAILVTDKINSPLDFSSQFIDKDKLIMELFTLDAIKEAQQAKIKSPKVINIKNIFDRAKI